jgi:2-oxoglutarate ferredoxin oxidoreductase subunit delta
MIVVVITDRCKGCGLCVSFCPVHVFSFDDKVNALGYFPSRVAEPQKCIECGLCERICPDLAVFLKEEI